MLGGSAALFAFPWTDVYVFRTLQFYHTLVLLHINLATDCFSVTGLLCWASLTGSPQHPLTYIWKKQFILMKPTIEHLLIEYLFRRERYHWSRIYVERCTQAKSNKRSILSKVFWGKLWLREMKNIWLADSWSCAFLCAARSKNLWNLINRKGKELNLKAANRLNIYFQLWNRRYRPIAFLCWFQKILFVWFNSSTSDLKSSSSWDGNFFMINCTICTTALWSIERGLYYLFLAAN